MSDKMEFVAVSQKDTGPMANKVALAGNQLPADTKWLFPEYDFKVMEIQRYSGVIIERILERGNWKQLRWLFATYGEHRVAEWVRKHGFRLLSKRSLALWQLVLGITTCEAPEWAIATKKADPW